MARVKRLTQVCLLQCLLTGKRQPSIGNVEPYKAQISLVKHHFCDKILLFQGKKDASGGKNVEGLTIKTEKRADIIILKAKGYIDSVTSPEIEHAVGELISKKNYKLVIDLSEVDYVSSAGWGIFVGYVKTARQNKGDIKFSHMKKEVLEIFELLDFTNILEYFKSVDDAIKAFIKK